jgi:ABC-type lipoprotein release transport system permease subunit
MGTEIVRLGNFLYLVKGYIFERRYRYVTTVFAIAVAMAVLYAVAALSLGIQKFVIPEMERMFPEKILIAKPRTADVNLMRLDVTAITDETIRKIQQVPGVERISPQVPLAFPVSAEGSIFGETIRTDVVVHGVSEWLVEQDVAPGETFRYSPNQDEPVPVLISQYFVDIYNLGLAQSGGLPQFNPQALTGRTFQLYLGEYMMIQAPVPSKRRQVVCKVVGLSRNLSLLGITMPLRYVEEFNEWYFGKPPVPAPIHWRGSGRYTAVHVFVRSLRDFDAVGAELGKLGLRVESHRETLSRYRSALRLAMLILLALGLSILVVALSNLANLIGLIMIERRGDVGLLKALGATRKEIVGAFVGEVCVIALMGSVLGAIVSLTLMRLAEMRLEKVLSRLGGILPRSVLYTHWALVPAGVLFAVLVSVAVALPIIRRAANRPAAELLTKE